MHAGHAAQHSEQKALPKQQATDEPNAPKQRPMLEGRDLKAREETEGKSCADVYRAGNSRGV